MQPKASQVKKSRVSSQITRSRILSAATSEFAEKGYDGARVDDIAILSGLQKNVIYYYFKSKEGLFTEVLIQTYSAIMSSREESSIEGLDPVEAMKKLVFATGLNWGRHPEFLRLLQSENICKGRHIKASGVIPQLYNPLIKAIKTVLQIGEKQGIFRSGIDPIELYISITSLSAHYVSHQHTFDAIFSKRLMTSKRFKSRLDHCAEMVVRYLLVDPRLDVQVQKKSILNLKKTKTSVK
jgi:TetR/AcrR family transcriptional regulator